MTFYKTEGGTYINPALVAKVYIHQETTIGVEGVENKGEYWCLEFCSIEQQILTCYFATRDDAEASLDNFIAFCKYDRFSIS